MIRLSSTVKKFLRNESKFSRTYFSTKVVTEDSDRFIFPRETEGNNYKVNWSMTEDGVTPVGDAFRNARFELLASRLGLPTQANSTISISSTILFGSYNITEAGDSITHDDFQDFKSAQSSYLSSGLDLYVEDASLGALSDIRVGVRIISSNPVLSLIYRNLLIPTPPRDVDHRARYNGWNQDERWSTRVPVWNGQNYDIHDTGTQAIKGQRPIVAFVGSLGNIISIQFVQSHAKVVGANILVGESAPIRGMIQAIGIASDALMNEDESVDGFAIPSTVVETNGRIAVIIGGEDEANAISESKNILYSPYNSYITDFGISSSWNGLLSKTPQSSKAVMSFNDGSILINNPDNLINPATDFIFIDKSSSSSDISEDAAVIRLVELTSETKKEAIKRIVKGKKFSIVSSVNEAFSLLRLH